MMILSVALGSLVGTFLGNLVLFWIIGAMAKKAQAQQKEKLEELHTAFLEARQKEVERMQRYAKMEG